jgi:ACR3 family arsenite efflux pump ArsB
MVSGRAAELGRWAARSNPKDKHPLKYSVGLWVIIGRVHTPIHKDVIMTPLQRVRVGFVGILCIWSVISLARYLTIGTPGLLSVIVALLAIPLIAIPLWREIQQTRDGTHRPLLTPHVERRFMRDLALFTLVLVFLLLSLFFGVQATSTIN